MTATAIGHARVSGLMPAPKHLCRVIALVVSCHRGTMAPDRATHRVAGIVTGSNGSVPVGEVRIEVTDTRLESRVAMARADSTGKFLIDLTDGDYAFAVTSLNESAFVEHVTAPIANLVIRLS